jgi:hypothetical protein
LITQSKATATDKVSTLVLQMVEFRHGWWNEHTQLARNKIIFCGTVTQTTPPRRSPLHGVLSLYYSNYKEDVLKAFAEILEM